ncbi:TonB-dependent receptor domain-containing protein [Sediminibacterium sp. C3]|uniref:TonB-dependent receptor family protein n=1 Tax=Sediminibacterium sp. C3 TaxID=1267211 RepID=UPI00042488EE|nr:TonB-dependent receptor [Sediminibacterium sp. C3]
MRGIAVLALVCITWVLNGQTSPSLTDTAASKNLPDITVVGRNSKSDYQQMPEIVGTNIYAGKKNALIVMDNVQGNVVNNTMRQVMAKIPGIHIWESDPSGIQIGIAARGLSPNRSWEFNVRQNGYDIAADPYGYPEAYYNPQLQAVQRIEVVRGQGSLQYGPQFGGLINYILRNGSEINKPIELETQQSFGSNGLFNSYNAIGGKKGKIHYYSFFDHREGNGWRENSRFYNNSGYATITYHFTNKFSLTAEVMRSNMRSQQPGGLTDNQIVQNAQQSLRSRNWFDITWTTPALIANYEISENTRWNTKLFTTFGDRNSVGFMLPITVKDSINTLTGNYNSRTVSLDQYRNYGLESRIITSYTLGKMQNNLSAGIRLYTGTTSRQADGVGSTGNNYDISISGQHPRDIVFRSNNVAAFVENIFRINEKLILIPGFRYEWIQGSASGRNGFAPNGNEILLQNITRNRGFLLAGMGAEYHITKTTEIYANYSQAYRPIQFANLQAPPTTDMVDPDLRDSKGYNFDIGYRGKIKNFLQFDISGFYLQYNNRVGVVTPNGSNYRLITNVGASTSKGIESYLEFNPARAFNAPTPFDLIVFSSYGYTDARYSGNHKDANTKGKRVENAPEHIMRAGITAGYKKWLFTWQYSHVGQAFSDANNTLTPTANGNNGLIPAYNITDITLTYKMNNKFNIKSGLNNLFDARYFTRRAGGYPGPGALPADGRTFFISLQAKL